MSKLMLMKCRCILCGRDLDVACTEETGTFISKWGPEQYVKYPYFGEDELNPPDVETLLRTRICPECIESLGVKGGFDPKDTYLGKCECGSSLFRLRDTDFVGNIRCHHCNRVYSIAMVSQGVEVEEIEDDD